MNAEQLKYTSMDSKTRFLKKVIVEENKLADELVSIFMGNKSEPRAKYLEENM